MNRDVESYLSDRGQFTTDEFVDMLREQDPTIGRSTIYKVLHELVQEERITRTSRGHFVCAARKSYSYPLSNIAADIASEIHNNYPQIDYQIWELYQMNEFVNHLFARNTIFVEVESMLGESVFQLLFDRYPHVLWNPTEEEYYRYLGTETIVVRELISESPAPYGDHQTSLEKILVDLFGRGIVGSIIQRAEYPAIFEDAYARYNINHLRLMRYARRRGIEQPIKTFIETKTRIRLEVGDD